MEAGEQYKSEQPQMGNLLLETVTAHPLFFEYRADYGRAKLIDAAATDDVEGIQYERCC